MTVRGNIKMWDVPERIPTSEEFAERDYPERRLWCAVIVNALHEYEQWLQRILNLWEAKQSPVPCAWRTEVKAMRSQLEHRWFGVICALADITQSMVLERLTRLERDYCFGAVAFDESEPILPYWKKRNLKTKPRGRH